MLLPKTCKIELYILRGKGCAEHFRIGEGVRKLMHVKCDKKYKTARCWYADPKKCFLPNFAIIDVNPIQLFDGKACNYFPSSKISFWDGAMPHGQCNGRMKPSLDPQCNPKKSEASLQQVVQYNWHPRKSWSINSIARPRISKQGNVASSSDLQFI